MNGKTRIVNVPIAEAEGGYLIPLTLLIPQRRRWWELRPRPPIEVSTLELLRSALEHR